MKSRIINNIVGKPLNIWTKRDFSCGLTSFDHIDIELVGHCNLNCKGCNHFSPIAEKSEISVDELERDLVQLVKVVSFEKINLLGGEPLLHSNITECMRVSRGCCKQAKITVVTNGILLINQSEAFWKTARDYGIEIEVTKYPINIDYRAIKNLAKKQSVKLYFYGRSKYIKKTLYSLPIDTKGSQDKARSFQNCFMARNCITLRNGKLYPCPYIAYMDRFNSTFGQSIMISEEDYCDIYKESTGIILDKMSKAIPACRYCDVSNRTYGNKWETSKREMSEWS